MKKTVTVFLFAVMMLSLFACGKNLSETDSGTEATATASQDIPSETQDASASDSELIVTDSSSDGISGTDTSSGTDSSSDFVTPPNTYRPIPESPPISRKQNLMAITDQKNDEIVVVKLSAPDITADSAIVWSWNAKKLGDVDYASVSNNRLDDVKLRHCDAWGGDVVGVTSSSGLMAVLEYPSGRCLWNQTAAGYGPHSIEILPDGRVAVALSGNSNTANGQIRIYAAQSKTDNKYASVSLVSAHGVAWDPEENLLWGLGGSTLDGYQIGGTRSDPTITKIAGTGSLILKGGGHDLSPVYGNPDRLWVSYSGAVMQFSKSQCKFLSDYEGYGGISVGSAKSVNSYMDETVVMTIADSKNGTATHDTNVVTMYRWQIDQQGTWHFVKETATFPNRDFYKVRVFVSDYQ